MIKLFRCRICGDPYIGEEAPSRCPFCGAYQEFIVEAKDYADTFDVELTEKDRANAEKALEVEISNASFYFCAAEKAEDDETKNLFKILAKVEREHASIWYKILKKKKEELPKYDTCSAENIGNLKESHEREDKAIKFYAQAAQESDHPRLKQLFAALVQVETDHLKLSEVRM